MLSLGYNSAAQCNDAKVRQAQNLNTPKLPRPSIAQFSIATSDRPCRRRLLAFSRSFHSCLQQDLLQPPSAGSSSASSSTGSLVLSSSLYSMGGWGGCGPSHSTCMASEQPAPLQSDLVRWWRQFPGHWNSIKHTCSQNTSGKQPFYSNKIVHSEQVESKPVRLKPK